MSIRTHRKPRLRIALALRAGSERIRAPRKLRSETARRRQKPGSTSGTRPATSLLAIFGVLVGCAALPEVDEASGGDKAAGNQAKLPTGCTNPEDLGDEYYQGLVSAVFPGRSTHQTVEHANGTRGVHQSARALEPGTTTWIAYLSTLSRAAGAGEGSRISGKVAEQVHYAKGVVDPNIGLDCKIPTGETATACSHICLKFTDLTRSHAGGELKKPPSRNEWAAWSLPQVLAVMPAKRLDAEGQEEETELEDLAKQVGEIYASFQLGELFVAREFVPQ